MPIASFAELEGDSLNLRALVGAVDGSVIYRSERNGSQHDAERLGIEVAEDLLKQGAKAILDAIKLA